MSLPDQLHSTARRRGISPATGRPLTKRGEATRRRLLEAAEHVFAEPGYHEASIVKITERAGVGLGTFYLYFDGKQAIFDALVIDLNRRVRHAMAEASRGGVTRLEAERAGFAGFFRFTAEHPGALPGGAAGRVRLTRDACACTTRGSSRATIEGLRAAQRAGDVDPRLDPDIAAWALMGMGELIGMRSAVGAGCRRGEPPCELPPALSTT